MRAIPAALILALAGVPAAADSRSAAVPELPDAGATVAAAPPCQSATVRIAFDFEGASASRCVVEGEREFTLIISPEHAPPINPSPWYAFRYEAQPGDPLTVQLRYLGARHRYAPKWAGSGDPNMLATEVAKDGEGATITLPPGSGMVSAQELVVAKQADALLLRLAAVSGAQRLALGQSYDGRAIEAVRLGVPDASHLVILLGRQHPPEVTGALAMEAFLTRIAALVESGNLDLAKTQLLIVPLLNPDGVARGHWRANLGGVDLNRDWGAFTQPETRAVKTWLDALPKGVRPIAMIDFHSTGRNLFYVQGEDETDAEQERFLQAWLGGKEEALTGYAFSIERRNANPGSGTAKNWFHQTYAIPSYTYEVADDADRESLKAAASALADALPGALATLD